MPMVPKLSAEEVANLVAHNHFLQQQLEAQVNLTTIVAFIAFREAKYLRANVIAAVGHPSLQIDKPLVLSVSQAELNSLGELYPGDRPMLGFQQMPVSGDLTMSMVPESYAAANVSPAEAARPN